MICHNCDGNSSSWTCTLKPKRHMYVNMESNWIDGWLVGRLVGRLVDIRMRLKLEYDKLISLRPSNVSNKWLHIENLHDKQASNNENHVRYCGYIIDVLLSNSTISLVTEVSLDTVTHQMRWIREETKNAKKDRARERKLYTSLKLDSLDNNKHFNGTRLHLASLWWSGLTAIISHDVTVCQFWFCEKKKCDNKQIAE